MQYFVVIVACACVLFFIWTSIAYRRRKKRENKRVDGPLFRTEENLEEYGKPMEPPVVDFDDED